jgi:hypothetical protein
MRIGMLLSKRSIIISARNVIVSMLKNSDRIIEINIINYKKKKNTDLQMRYMMLMAESVLVAMKQEENFYQLIIKMAMEINIKER